VIQPIRKTPSGIAGIDAICGGGLPEGRVTLIAGSSGAAKTIMAAQFLIHGATEMEQSAVLVTCEENPEDLRANLASFGWDVAALEAAGRWAFVDASPQPEPMPDSSVPLDLSGLLAQIRYQVETTGARRVAVDSISTLLGQFVDTRSIRIELLRLVNMLKELGVTAVMTAERLDEYGPVSRFGVEDFVTDAVIILRQNLAKDQVRRTAQVLKYRGSTHLTGEIPYVIDQSGIRFVSMHVELDTGVTSERCSWGNADLDRLSGGGALRESITLVSGATGTGKDLIATHFVGEGLKREERALYLSYEESTGQVKRSAMSIGFDFDSATLSGLLRIEANNPGTLNLLEHLIALEDLIAEQHPARIGLDSLSALRSYFSPENVEEFVLGLTSILRRSGATAVVTNTSSSLSGVDPGETAELSTLADTVILLGFVELKAEMHRGITILRMRGSRHDASIRRFIVGEDGYHIGAPFREVGGILAGAPTQLVEIETEELGDMFQD